MKKRKLRFAILVLAAAFAFAGCGSSEKEQEEEVLATEDNADTTDPDEIQQAFEDEMIPLDEEELEAMESDDFADDQMTSAEPEE